MDPPGGKIKFGFSKVIKKPNLVIQNSESAAKIMKIEMIEEIEGSSIKIFGKDLADDIAKKLVIPMTNDQKTTPLSKLLEDRKKNSKSRTIKIETKTDVNSTEVQVKQEPLEETIEQQAARELVEDLQNKIVKTEVKVFEVPINADELPLAGAKESSLDDYDRVPIGDFGKAMLRGMGWKDEVEEDSSKTGDFDGPILRPKGMGLGADKVIKKQPLLVAPNQFETLEIKKKACVKVLAGKHKNSYGTVEGFDDGGGRIIVKLAIGGLKVTLNEFMAQPISKQEFAIYGKVLNSAKFEEYKFGEAKNPSTSKEVEEKRPQGERTLERKQVRNGSAERKPERRRSIERLRSRSRERSRSRDRKIPHKSSDNRRVVERSNDTSTRKYRGRSRSRDKRSRRSSSSSVERKHKKKSSKHKTKYSSPDSQFSSDTEKKHKKKSKKSKNKRR